MYVPATEWNILSVAVKKNTVIPRGSNEWQSADPFWSLKGFTILLTRVCWPFLKPLRRPSSQIMTLNQIKKRLSIKKALDCKTKSPS